MQDARSPGASSVVKQVKGAPISGSSTVTGAVVVTLPVFVTVKRKVMTSPTASKVAGVPAAIRLAMASAGDCAAGTVTEDGADVTSATPPGHVALGTTAIVSAASAVLVTPPLSRSFWVTT